MKKGEKVSRTDLVKNGWEFITRFGLEQVWGKNLDRVMWNPDTEIIGLCYTHRVSER
jgi:hypothetical protein